MNIKSIWEVFWKALLGLVLVYLVCDIVQKVSGFQLRKYIASPLSSVGVDINTPMFGG